MKRITMCMVLMMLLSMAMATRVEQPTDLLRYDNLEFSGQGSILADGSSVLAWLDTKDTTKHVNLMRFSAENVPMWQHPQSIPLIGTYYLASTMDATFLIMQHMTRTVAFKFDAAGNSLWPGFEVYYGSSGTPYQISLYPDSEGGVWMCMNAQNYVFSNHHCSVQRLDSDGNLAFYNLIWGEYLEDCYLRDGLLLEDDSLVISMATREKNTLVSITKSGVVQGMRDFPSNPLSLEYSSLDQLSASQIVYTVGKSDSVDAYLVNISEGLPIEDSFVYSLGEGAAQYVQVNALEDDTALICVSDYSQTTVQILKINSFGEQQYLINYHKDYDSKLQIHPAEEGQCFVVQNDGTQTIKIDKLSSQGSILWSRNIISPENGSGTSMSFASDFQADSFRIYWMDYRTEASGIYGNTFSSAGNPIFADTGIPLITGSRGFVLLTDVCPLGTGVAMMVLTKEDNQSQANLRLSMIEPIDGWSPSGIIISDECNGDYMISAKMLKAGDFVLILWLEKAEDYLLKAQLVSQNGLKMWGETGISIASGEIFSYFGTIIEGKLYIAWQFSEDGIHLQKVDNGMLQWSNTLLDITMPPNTPDRLMEFISGYMVLEGSDGIRILRVNSEGGFHSAFGNAGLNIEGGFDGFISARCLQDNLILTCRDSGGYLPGQSYSMVISPEGEIYYGEQQLSCSGYLRPFLKDAYLYAAGYDTSLWITKYNLQSESLWTKRIAIDIPSYDGTLTGRIEALSDSVFALLYCVSDLDYKFYYVVFDASGGLITESPIQLWGNFTSFSRSYAIVKDKIHLLYTDFQYGKWVKWQIVEVDADPDNGATYHAEGSVVFGSSFPNPFFDSTSFRVYCNEPQILKLNVYNLKGQLIRRLHTNSAQIGLQTVLWDGKDENGYACASGVYFVRMEVGGKVKTTKTIRMK